MQGKNEIVEFRNDLYNSFPKLKDSLMNLVDSLCSSGHVITSVVQLSKSSSFDREYSSVTAAITKGLPEVDFNKISRLVYDKTSEIGLNKPYRFLIDCTPHPRNYARKLVDRHITHFPNSAPGNKPICVGHQYSVLTMLPEEKGELSKRWLIPISAQRVSSEEKGNELGMRQVTESINNLELSDNLCISIGDSLYGTEACRIEADKQKNLVHIFRISNNRNLYSKPNIESLNSSSKGRKKEFGHKMNLGKLDTHIPYNTEEEFQWTNYKGIEYTVRVRCWKDMLLRGSRHYNGSKHPMNLVQIRILDTNKKEVHKRPLWLCVFGARRNDVSAIDAYKNYKSRYDIEHFFRFGKQKLLFTSYQTPKVEHEELWWKLCLIAYAQLYLGKSIVSSHPEPWESYLPEYKDTSCVKNQAISPSQVQKNFSNILQMIGTPAKTSVARGRKSGRLLGEKQIKRESLDIVFKSKAAIQKKLKSIITETENKTNISKPEKITSLVELVQKLLKKANITPEQFSNLLLDST